MAALAEGRMMGCDQECLPGFVLCNFRQCRLEPIELRRVVAAIALQETGAFKPVRIQPDDPNERCIQQPIDARLRHVVAEDAASRSLWWNGGRIGAEMGPKRRQ